jgi:hypothetical protein
MTTDTAKIKERLVEIADLMKRPGANIEQLSAEIDRLLGTGLPTEDKRLAGAWERSHRRGR